MAQAWKRANLLRDAFDNASVGHPDDDTGCTDCPWKWECQMPHDWASSLALDGLDTSELP